jgi:protein disulfide-isomerase-like protein
MANSLFFVVVVLCGLALVAGDSRVMQLDASNFDVILTNANTVGKPMFVMNYAPWCGHCKALHPTYDQLAEASSIVDSVVIASLDCANDANTDLCSRFNIRGFPTLLLMAGDRMWEYRGERTLEAMTTFVTSSYNDQESVPLPGPPGAKEYVRDALYMIVADARQMWAFKKNIIAIIFALGFFIGMLYGKNTGAASTDPATSKSAPPAKSSSALKEVASPSPSPAKKKRAVKKSTGKRAKRSTKKKK